MAGCVVLDLEAQKIHLERLGSELERREAVERDRRYAFIEFGLEPGKQSKVFISEYRVTSSGEVRYVTSTGALGQRYDDILRPSVVPSGFKRINAVLGDQLSTAVHMAAAGRISRAFVASPAIALNGSVLVEGSESGFINEIVAMRLPNDDIRVIVVTVQGPPGAKELAAFMKERTGFDALTGVGASTPGGTGLGAVWVRGDPVTTTSFTSILDKGRVDIMESGRSNYSGGDSNYVDPFGRSVTDALAKISAEVGTRAERTSPLARSNAPFPTVGGGQFESLSNPSHERSSHAQPQPFAPSSVPVVTAARLGIDLAHPHQLSSGVFVDANLRAGTASDLKGEVRVRVSNEESVIVREMTRKQYDLSGLTSPHRPRLEELPGPRPESQNHGTANIREAPPAPRFPSSTPDGRLGETIGVSRLDNRTTVDRFRFEELRQPEPNRRAELSLPSVFSDHTPSLASRAERISPANAERVSSAIPVRRSDRSILPERPPPTSFDLSGLPQAMRVVQRAQVRLVENGSPPRPLTRGAGAEGGVPPRVRSPQDRGSFDSIRAFRREAQALSRRTTHVLRTTAVRIPGAKAPFAKKVPGLTSTERQIVNGNIAHPPRTLTERRQAVVAKLKLMIDPKRIGAESLQKFRQVVAHPPRTLTERRQAVVAKLKLMIDPKRIGAESMQKFRQVVRSLQNLRSLGHRTRTLRPATPPEREAILRLQRRIRALTVREGKPSLATKALDWVRELIDLVRPLIVFRRRRPHKKGKLISRWQRFNEGDLQEWFTDLPGEPEERFERPKQSGAPRVQPTVNATLPPVAIESGPYRLVATLPPARHLATELMLAASDDSDSTTADASFPEP